MPTATMWWASCASRESSSRRRGQRPIIDLETRLAELHWTRAESRDIQKIYNPMSPAQVAELAPELDWPLIFADAGLGDVDTFVVAQTTAIDAAAELFAATPLALLRDYLAFHLIRRHAEYLSSDFDTANFELYSRTLSGTEEQRERWKRGVEQVNDGLGEAVGRIYVERHFPAEYKAQMDQLIANLVSAMKERLERNEWMDEETRDSGAREARDVRAAHGISVEVDRL